MCHTDISEEGVELEIYNLTEFTQFNFGKCIHIVISILRNGL